MPGHQIPLSTCTANYGDADLFQVIDRAAELGLDGVEITVMYHLPAETSAARLAEVKQKLDDTGIRAASLHFIYPSGLSLVHDDAAERGRVVDHIGRIGEMAAAVGANVVMVGGGPIRSSLQGTDHQEAERRVVEVYDAAAKLTGSFGVPVAFEALNRYETNIGHSLRSVLDLIAEVDNPWLGIGADTFHMNIEETDLAAAIRQAGSRIKHIHLADSNRLAPGSAHTDFAAILAALQDIDYQGWMSMELFAIAPGLMYLPTWEACDEQVANGAAHIRALQGIKR